MPIWRLRRSRIDPKIDRSFGWLRDLGFTPARAPSGTSLDIDYSSDRVVVAISYDWRDSYLDVSLRERTDPTPAPYWRNVHLHELLERAGRERVWNPPAEAQEAPIEVQLQRAASLLREVAADQLRGKNLELLDTIIAGRPRSGVPGLDFPTDEPWAQSQEGLWFPTKWPGPPSVTMAIEGTSAGSASERASSALWILPGLTRRRQRQAAITRLRELLYDAEPDVRGAAASTLAEWDDLNSLDRILELLDAEPGDRFSPIAAAATFIGIWKDKPLRDSIVSALERFASRGSKAQLQVARLQWRLADDPSGYPRTIEMWQ